MKNGGLGKGIRTSSNTPVRIVGGGGLPSTFNSHRGHAVVQLVEALRYKPEGRGFDFRWFHWNFSLTKSFQPHYGPGVD